MSVDWSCSGCVDPFADLASMPSLMPPLSVGASESSSANHSYTPHLSTLDEAGSRCISTSTVPMDEQLGSTAGLVEDDGCREWLLDTEDVVMEPFDKLGDGWVSSTGLDTQTLTELGSPRGATACGGSVSSGISRSSWLSKEDAIKHNFQSPDKDKSTSPVKVYARIHRDKLVFKAPVPNHIRTVGCTSPADQKVFRKVLPHNHVPNNSIITQFEVYCREASADAIARCKTQMGQPSGVSQDRERDRINKLFESNDKPVISWNCRSQLLALIDELGIDSDAKRLTSLFPITTLGMRRLHSSFQRRNDVEVPLKDVLRFNAIVLGRWDEIIKFLKCIDRECRMQDVQSANRIIDDFPDSLRWLLTSGSLKQMIHANGCPEMPFYLQKLIVSEPVKPRVGPYETIASCFTPAPVERCMKDEIRAQELLMREQIHTFWRAENVDVPPVFLPLSESAESLYFLSSLKSYARAIFAPDRQKPLRLPHTIDLPFPRMFVFKKAETTEDQTS